MKRVKDKELAEMIPGEDVALGKPKMERPVIEVIPLDTCNMIISSDEKDEWQLEDDVIETSPTP